MRNYCCTFSLVGDTPTMKACWSGVEYRSTYKTGDTIIIDNYTNDKTKKYIKLLVDLINEVQPCKLVKKSGKTYISYKLIGHYNNDLILLNFIRNLWDEPHVGYTAAFFEKLKKLKTSKISAMEKLLTANLHGSKESNHHSTNNHSNCGDFKTLKVMPLPEDFYSKDSGSTLNFLEGVYYDKNNTR